jgi:MFS family permease
MFTESYKRYVLGALTLVYTLNYLDRGLIILLLQPIKEDLHLSDTQLGFVTGIAFALFYATLGVPIARWADRGNRVTITSIAIALWGMTVMLCLFVANFAHLILARVAAAIGESGCMPPTYSLVGDYFPGPAQRTRAMAVYWLASPVALLISLMAGGWLNGHCGWRLTFFFAGVPALAVAVLVKITVTEPRAAHAASLHVPARPLPSMTQVLATLWRQRSARHLGLAIILFFMMGLGLTPWYAAFMIRSHGMNTTELGVWLGVIFGVCGATGMLLGGYVAGKWFKSDERGQMRFTAVMVALLVPCFALFLLLPHKYQALMALAGLMVVFNVFVGPTFALMQRLVRDDMRATALAVIMLLANLIGMGIGPQLVGILSDLFVQVAGIDSLRYSMLLVSLLALWPAYHFWCVGSTVMDELADIAQRTGVDAEQAAGSHSRPFDGNFQTGENQSDAKGYPGDTYIPRGRSAV